MAMKESKEIARAEQPRSLQTLWDFDTMFDDFLRKPFSIFGLPRMRFPEMESVTPTVDIFEEKGDVVVKAELPGINKEDLDVTVSEDTITIAGEKKKEEERLKIRLLPVGMFIWLVPQNIHLARRSANDKGQDKI